MQITYVCLSVMNNEVGIFTFVQLVEDRKLGVRWYLLAHRLD